MRILVVKISSLGDIISTLPAITEAWAAQPGLELDWVVEENFVEIPSLHPAVRRVIPVALRRWRHQLSQPRTWREAQDFLRVLRQRSYDWILDPQGLLKSALIAKIACGRVAGYDYKSAREPLASCFYNHKLAISKSLHAVDRIRQLFARVLAYKINEPRPNYGLPVFVQTPEMMKEPYLVFAHGSSRDNKCWQEAKWIELAAFAAAAGYKIKLPWGNQHERLRAQRIAAGSTACEVLAPLPLKSITTLLAAATGVVAVDTGLGHLSAALGTPAVSLYGPTDPRLAGTYGKHQLQLTQMATLPASAVWRTLVNLLETAQQ